MCDSCVCVSVLPQEKQRMTDKLEDTSLRLKDEMDLYRKMMDKLRQNRNQFQKEKENMQEVRETVLCNQMQTQSGLFALQLTLFPLFSILSSPPPLRFHWLIHPHPQNTALPLHNNAHLSFLSV